jgi:hypothetical protein
MKNNDFTNSVVTVIPNPIFLFSEKNIKSIKPVTSEIFFSKEATDTILPHQI